VNVPAGGLLRLHSGAGRVALTATVLASSVALLDSTVANVALPHIGEDLGGDLAGLQWVVTGYLLTLASFILLGGALGDRYGRRRVFRIGAWWFGLASLACALAPSLTLLVAARLLQGVGAALLTPTSLALTQSSYVEDDRAAAVGAWSGLGGIAGAIGPLVGGWLVDGPGWRWAFLVNLPLVAGALVATRAVPAAADGDAHEAGARTHFDVLGALLAAASLGTATWALTQGPERGWSDPAIIVAAVTAVAAGVAFVVRQRVTAFPLVPHGLFASRTFTVLNVSTFALYATLSAQFFLLAYQLQVGAGWSALAAGSALLPSTLLMLVLSERSGALAARIGPRPQLVIGPLLIAAAQLLLARLDESANWFTDVLPGAVLFGVGLVTFVAPLTAAVMGSVDPSHVGTASGVNNAVARTAGLVAVAVVPVVSGLTTAVGPDEVTQAYRIGMWITAGSALVAALVSAVGLPRRTRQREGSRPYFCAVDGAPLQAGDELCHDVELGGGGAPGAARLPE
jgi:EmrB/QacA subfamily drug resistance transporter